MHRTEIEDQYGDLYGEDNFRQADVSLSRRDTGSAAGKLDAGVRGYGSGGDIFGNNGVVLYRLRAVRQNQHDREF